MKKLLFTLVIVLSSFSAMAQGRGTTLVSVNEANADCVKPTINVLTAPLIADISVSKTKVTYVETEAFRNLILTEKLIFEQMPAMKNVALSNAVKKYDADLFIGVNISARTNEEGCLEITVIGYPATYTNFRTATEEEVQTAYYARLATEGKEGDPLMTDNDPTVVKAN